MEGEGRRKNSRKRNKKDGEKTEREGKNEN
jgi:hypothetical protein